MTSFTALYCDFAITMQNPNHLRLPSPALLTITLSKRYVNTCALV